MTIEVRCCCQPMKLLGWMEIPSCLEISLGRTLRFPVHGGGVIELPVETISISKPIPFPIQAGTNLKDLPIDRHLALKSEETPIETLRRVRSFLENTDTQEPA